MENDNEYLITQDRDQVYHKHCYCQGIKCCACGEFNPASTAQFADWSIKL